jgi:hypothetical protein
MIQSLGFWAYQVPKLTKYKTAEQCMVGHGGESPTRKAKTRRQVVHTHVSVYSALNYPTHSGGHYPPGAHVEVKSGCRFAEKQRG